MDLGIAGKLAVVTGGSTGLGYAIAERLAKEGANLLIFARDPDKLSACRHKLEAAHGVNVATCAGDIAASGDVIALAQQARSIGMPQILIVNTPRPPSPMRDFLDETDDERWSQAYRDQLHGALLILRHLAPLLIETGWGRIVGITSASVKQPMPRHALSSVFRAGFQTALKHLSTEAAAMGVTVNAVAPATVVTPTFAVYHNLERRVAEVPVQRAGTAEELAATVAFLASTHAGFITGETLQFDGGATRSLL